MDKLLNKYVGATASRYETKRQNSPKWQMENTWFTTLLSTINVKTVLDAPVGTGRFLPTYRARRMSVTGIDASPDMLTIAREKGIGHLILGDILDPDCAGTFDLVVCVRFLNWLDIQQMGKALSNLSKFSHRYIILTITVSNMGSFTKPNGAFIPSMAELLNLPAWKGWYRLDEKKYPSSASTHYMWLMSRDREI